MALVKDKEIRLKIVGAGAEENNYRALIKKLSLDDRIEILPSKYGKELFDCVRGARGVVVPSVWYENWPLYAPPETDLKNFPARSNTD